MKKEGSSLRAALRRGIPSAALLGLALVAGPVAAGTMTVYKTATCGCCKAWVEHVRAAGFEVTARDVPYAELVERKREQGVDPALASCHTALVDGYVIEGHVPAADIRRLLGERPDIAGLAVPGMPVGSPGMEVGGRSEAYSVVAFDAAGGMRLYSHYGE
ncbi:MAG: DUF411 domain-containing protein [Halofilum sp. (in: g-proteobacteria)]|nr:DUF411 domain-containing protein [Halofilum sp. (in: g-proteobacteria)]